MCVFNVMVRPGTHLVKHRESLSITNESQFIKTRRPKLKLLGLLCIKPDSYIICMENKLQNSFHSLLK